jgi:hypothetical protein
VFPPGRRLPPGPPSNGGPRCRARGRAHPESTSHRRHSTASTVAHWTVGPPQWAVWRAS